MACIITHNILLQSNRTSNHLNYNWQTVKANEAIIKAIHGFAKFTAHTIAMYILYYHVGYNRHLS